MRTKEDKLRELRVRLNKVMARGKHEDCPGVVTKLRRQIVKLEQSLN